MKAENDRCPTCGGPATHVVTFSDGREWRGCSSCTEVQVFARARSIAHGLTTATVVSRAPAQGEDT